MESSTDAIFDCNHQRNKRDLKRKGLQPMPFCCAGICALTLTFTVAAHAADTDESTYFIVNGNPVAVKYSAGRLKRLPFQDAPDVESIKKLEAVSALLRAPRLTGLSTLAQRPIAHLSPPRLPEYGTAMFDLTTVGPAVQGERATSLVWSGATPFREVELSLPGVDSRWKRSLVIQSRDVLAPWLDYRAYKSVGRQLEIDDGPVNVRDYGRSAAAPHLAFVDITWHIKALPEVLSNSGINSLLPFLRVAYVVNTKTGKSVYIATSNVAGTEGRDMRLFKEPGGPLLMAVTIPCTDGDEPLIVDLEHETYGTGRQADVPEVAHCFPAH